ncbi:MAG: hypothetical protein JWP41_3 [Ramlibacter sp.]|nr:hypothetical protein [Ramlibacter sp.]
MTPGVDWARPWFAPWREAGEPVAAALRAGQPQHDALNGARATAVRFVPQDALPPGTAYEQFIFDTGLCPVRPGLHDFFNGLVWLRMPATKRRLNELQALEIAAGATGGRRGRVRDAITVFDENGALLQAPPALWQALVERDWRRLFVDLRPQWQDARLLVVGHALLEKLAAPRKDLTAHVWAIPCADVAFAVADGWLAAECTPAALAAKPFTPLPVLGIPGWWPANENFSFYDDSVVFRPARPDPRA